ncbi:MAG: peptidoglycan recognition protein family protein [Alphaproteobacteria bacterium]|nr:peptidoglycan recognition protein family protein [Alphaproteobacteria bacterium]
MRVGDQQTVSRFLAPLIPGSGGQRPISGLLVSLTAGGFILLSLIGSATAAAEQRNCREPAIVPRADWSAAPAIENRMIRQVPRSIVIHHTGVKSHPHLPLEQKLRDLQSYAQRPGSEDGRPKPALGDTPYHFFIGYGGRIGEGRSLDFAGDTRTNYDTADRIQIVVEGDFDVEHPQDEQLASLEELLCWLGGKFAIAKSSVRTHSEVAATRCPGANLLSALSRLKSGG